MRRIFSWILIIALSLGLCACGHNVETQWQEQYDLGVRCLSDGNYEEAIIAFTAAIEIDPKQASAYVGRGNAYIGRGETEENLAVALADYQSALELDDTRVDVYLGLADVYIRLGDFDKAQAILKTGVEKTGDQLISDKLEAIEEGVFKDSNGKVRKSITLDSESILEKGFEKTGDQSIADKINEIESGIFLDSSSNVRRQNEYNENHELVGYSTTSYNEYGSMQRSSWYDQNGNLLHYCTYTYWKDNLRWEKVSTYLADGSLTAYECYEYDISGKQVGEYFYNGDGTLQLYDRRTDVYGAVHFNPQNSKHGISRPARAVLNARKFETFIVYAGYLYS